MRGEGVQVCIVDVVFVIREYMELHGKTKIS